MPTGVSIAGALSYSVKVGDTRTLSASFVPDTAFGGLTWDSTNPAVAAVDQNGRVTAIRPGMASIIARSDRNGVTGQVRFTVTSDDPSVKNELPLSGVIIALWLTGRSLDMIGALGLVLLVGIVVKNGIVLVDYINLMRERGYELNQAIQMSGRSRIRPVLMTAFTTILGMVPMAVSSGEGAEMWQPLGIVVIGGLTVSTFLTLYIVPVLYGVMSRHGDRDKQEALRKKFIFMDLKVKKGEEK